MKSILYICDMKSAEILKILKEDKNFLKDNFGVNRIALFGSFAKNTNKEESDIDFFVELSHPSYNSLMNLYGYLEVKFQSKIDIVRKGPHLSEKFIKSIQKDLIYA